MIHVMIPSFAERVEKISPEYLSLERLETLQVNLGNLCNQYCRHCHVEAGPSNDRRMTKEVMAKIIEFLRNRKGITLDITGGAPELHPRFQPFVEEARGWTPRLMVRTNLTVLAEDAMARLPQWYGECQVVLIASLPCYTKENVDGQRGRGVFEKSISVLKKLNDAGYGDTLELNLVYNPGGDFLPGSQGDLERDYKEILLRNYGIRFHRLYTITNAPLGRFRHELQREARLVSYVRLLADNFNPGVVPYMMCRKLISVGWQGILYNCDFNQAADMSAKGASGRILKIDDLAEAVAEGLRISMSEHCYACTAGPGSSCTGVLASR